MYVIIQSERNLFTVGYYNPFDNFVPHCDTDNRVMAERIVNYLNGGNGFPFDLKPPAPDPLPGYSTLTGERPEPISETWDERVRRAKLREDPNQARGQF